MAVGTAIVATLVLVSCGDDSVTTADDRPLAERTALVGPAPITLSEPWWRTAVEASPATVWRLDGKTADVADLLVIGEVTSVRGLGSLRDPALRDPKSSNITEADFVDFHAAEAVTDLVSVSVRVDDGVAEAGRPVPDEVAIVLALPSPTDVQSLEDELREVESVAAIVFRAPIVPSAAVDAAAGGLYQPLDSFYFGPVVGGMAEFGVFLPSPSDSFSAESVAVADLLRGAGEIELATLDGLAVRLSELSESALAELESAE